MRAALAVHTVTNDRKTTLQRILHLVHEASDQGADLALFSETAVTGFKATDDPEHDVRLGESIPGPTTEEVAAVAHDRSIWVALGLYEIEGGRLYDSAVLISPDGSIRLKHRRSDGRWHSRNANPNVYGSGVDVRAAETPWGNLTFLLCGELINDTHISAVRELAPTYLLVPFARGYDEDALDDKAWYEENLAFYAEQTLKAGVITLMTNHLDSDGPCCFGGAVAFSAEGHVIASKPLHEEGLLVVDV